MMMLLVLGGGEGDGRHRGLALLEAVRREPSAAMKTE